MSAQPVSLPTSARAVLLRRLFSVSGVLALGVFLLAHLYTNTQALKGQAAFGDFVRSMRSSLAITVLEIAGIFAPLAFHAIYGAWLTFTKKPLRAESPYPPALARAMRITGIVALLYVGW